MTTSNLLQKQDSAEARQAQLQSSKAEEFILNILNDESKSNGRNSGQIGANLLQTDSSTMPCTLGCDYHDTSEENVTQERYNQIRSTALSVESDEEAAD